MTSGKLFGTDARTYLLAIILTLPLFAGTVWAQVTASITGTVKDTSGAIVPEATVTVKNIESGLTRIAQTDAGGNYTIAAIPVGQYELDAEKPGF